MISCRLTVSCCQLGDGSQLSCIHYLGNAAALRQSRTTQCLLLNPLSCYRTYVNPYSTAIQVESHIQEWTESAEKMEKMTAAEAKRFVGGKVPDTSNLLRMTANMQHKIKKEAPSKDAEKMMLKAWQRRMQAYYKIAAMLHERSHPPTMTTASQLDTRMCSVRTYWHTCRVVEINQIINLSTFTWPK